MEERPASITAFSEIVASHKILWRKNWHFFSVSKFKSWLDHLSERDGITWTASSLISQWVGKIKTFEISEVISFWKHWVRDFIGRFVLIIPLLCFLKSNFKFFASSRSEFFREGVFLDIWGGLCQVLGYFSVTMASILSMVPLELASVCLPTKVLTIDKRDSFISIIGCLVLSMSIEPCGRCSWGCSCLCLLDLKIASIIRLCDDLVLLRNNSHLNSIWFCFNRDSFFHIVMGLLLCVEADYVVVCHTVPFLG